MWQYSSTGYIAGIQGGVDMNYDYSVPVNAAVPGRPEFPGASAKPFPAETAAAAPPDIFYAVKTRNHGILPDVKNRSDYAGWQDSEIVAVKIGVTSGLSLIHISALGVFDVALADYLKTKDLSAEVADISKLSADSAFITYLQTQFASLTELDAAKVDVEQLIACLLYTSPFLYRHSIIFRWQNT